MSWLNFWKKPRECRPDMLFQQLEERIVLDAAVTPALQPNQDNHTQDNHTQDQAQQQASQGSAPPADHAAPGTSGLEAPTVSQVVQTHDLNVVLISNALPDAQAIAQAAVPDAKIVVYDAVQDNLESITTQLSHLVDSTGQKIGVLALIDHASKGDLEIGTDHVTLFNLNAYKGEFQQLGTLLGSHAQIQFYGCDCRKPDSMDRNGVRFTE